ncbi:MAG TPA: hypothetical protein VMU47_11930, partial [Caldimonas sp.]|nr:hypothetical protein [Caldimonas sp.]
MSRGTSLRSARRWCAFAAFATWACAASTFALAQSIRVVDVPLVAAPSLQFHRLAAPSTTFSAQMMVQDDLGFLWFSDADALRRYDGYGFMQVPDERRADKVGFIIGQSLMKDHLGRVWVGADDSLNRYDPASGEFKQYRSANEACGTLAIAHDIVEDPEGVMWLATDDGVTAFDPVTSKVTCHRPRYTPSIGETRVIAMIPVRDGSLWITSSEGL